MGVAAATSREVFRSPGQSEALLGRSLACWRQAAATSECRHFCWLRLRAKARQSALWRADESSLRGPAAMIGPPEDIGVNAPGWSSLEPDMARWLPFSTKTCCIFQWVDFTGCFSWSVDGQRRVDQHIATLAQMTPLRA